MSGDTSVIARVSRSLVQRTCCSAFHRAAEHRCVPSDSASVVRLEPDRGVLVSRSRPTVRHAPNGRAMCAYNGRKGVQNRPGPELNRDRSVRLRRAQRVRRTRRSAIGAERRADALEGAADVLIEYRERRDGAMQEVLAVELKRRRAAVTIAGLPRPRSRLALTVTMSVALLVIAGLYAVHPHRRFTKRA